MTRGHALIMKRSVWLWAATFITIAFNLFAAFQGDPGTTFLALLLSGLMAIGGIGFGLWAGGLLAHEHRGAR